MPAGTLPTDPAPRHWDVACRGPARSLPPTGTAGPTTASTSSRRRSGRSSSSTATPATRRARRRRRAACGSTPRTRIRKGGDSGPVVKANDEDSLLLRAVAHAPDVPAMPPKGKLPDAADRRPAEVGEDGRAAPGRDRRQARGRRDGRASSGRSSRVAEHPAPKVSDPKWPVRKADFFVLAEARRAEARPAPAADRRTLIRRVYFDLDRAAADVRAGRGVRRRHPARRLRAAGR